MLRLMPLALILLLAAGAGCGKREIPPQGAYPRALGTVDTSLSPDLQAKQQVVKTLFDALSVGMRLEELPDQNPNLRFDESPEEFLERGAVGLAGWQFDGQPQGDDVPVVLYLNLDGTGRNQLQVRRVYTVTGSPDRFRISRKP
jgi:hypothetical protein